MIDAVTSFLKSLNWGSVPDWFAATGTILAVIVALTIAGRDTRRVLSLNRRSQARKISAWQQIVQGTEVPVIINTSTLPIYDIVVSYGVAYGAGDAYMTGNENQVFIQKLPPGRWRIKLSPQKPEEGMHIRLSLSICFRDADGNFWLRDATGVLKEIKQSPHVYMGIHNPIEKWSSFVEY